MQRTQRRARGHGQADLALPALERHLQLAEQLLHRQFGMALVHDPRQQQREAVVADAADVILFARDRTQLHGDMPERLVAECVAMRGIDPRETVDVDHHQREHGLAVVGETDMPAQQRQEAAAVVQPGQFVLERHACTRRA